MNLLKINEYYEEYLESLKAVGEALPTIDLRNIITNYQKYRSDSQRILIESHLH